MALSQFVSRELADNRGKGKRPYHHGEPMWRFYLRASIQVAVLERRNPVKWWLHRIACWYLDRRFWTDNPMAEPK